MRGVPRSSQGQDSVRAVGQQNAAAQPIDGGMLGHGRLLGSACQGMAEGLFGPVPGRLVMCRPSGSVFKPSLAIDTPGCRWLAGWSPADSMP